MKIGINGYEAIVPRFGFEKDSGLPIRVGSSEVCYQLLVELEKTDLENEYIIYLPSVPTSDLPKERPNWRYKIVKGQKLWTLIALNKEANKDSLDVFFNPTHYAPLFLNCPLVISILDVSYKYFPELFKKKDLYKLSLWGKYSVKKAASIVTISNSSKDDIMKEYGVVSRKIHIISVGIKEIIENKMSKEEFIHKYKLSNSFVLFVGTLQPRKNVVRLIEAFAKQDNKNIDLVIVGKKGWNYEEILQTPNRLGINDRVHFLHNVSNEDLPAFYKHAECFVLPSLYEGFGLPVLEAMKYGCPVITSDVSSLPEAGGDAALYCDPEDIESICSKMTELLKDEKLQEKLVKRGYEHVKKFSWEKSAKEVLSVLKQI